MHCPGPKGKAVEEEVRQPDGSILLVRTERQSLFPRVVPWASKPSKLLRKYCLSFSGDDAAKRLMSEKLVGISASTMENLGSPPVLMDSTLVQRFMNWVVTHVVPLVVMVAERPDTLLELLLFGCVLAMALTFTYLLGLYWFAPVLVPAAVWGSVVVCVGTGFGLLAAAGVIPGLHPDQLFAAPTWLEVLLYGWGGQWIVLAVGACLFIAGLVLALWAAYSRRSLGVTVSCVQHACSILFSMPTLLLLPILEAALSLAATLVLLTGLAALATTLEVEGRTIGGLAGIFRHFEVEAPDAARLVIWVFGLFWAQELGAALSQFALAYSVAIWYVAPGATYHQKALGVTFPALRGLLIGLTYHLGSLAYGSLIVTLFRVLRWALFVSEQVFGPEDDERSGTHRRRWRRSAMGCCAAMLRALEAWRRFLNDNAMAEVALSSKAFGEAGDRAHAVLANNMGVVTMLTFFSRIVCSAAVVSISAAAGVCAYWSATVPAAQELLGTVAGGPAREVSAMVSTAVVIAYIVARSVMGIVDVAARTLLYCFLWDASDGVVDAPYVPASFKSFALAQGIRVTKTAQM